MSSRANNHIDTTFHPNPLQQQFIMSRAPADLFSSRVGEGKSTALAWSVLFHTRHNPGAEWAIVRDTYENLKRSTQKTFFDWFPPGVYGDYHKGDKKFTWYKEVADGAVYFTGMEAPDDASKLLSWELAGVAMDEPAPAVGSMGIDEFVFDIAKTRLRQPGMNWYAMKLATNNPDESHWTYKKFVTPGIDGFQYFQPTTPENAQNLPDGYYEEMRRTLAHRPDLIRRFVDGEFGFQIQGKAVTPQWNDKIHLTHGLVALPRKEIILLWDFGHNPTCIITQISPEGYWLILESYVGTDIGAEELIKDVVKPVLHARYRKNPIRHIGDPQGNQREQTSIKRFAVKSIKRELGGRWTSGPVRWHKRIDPLQAVLTRTMNGRGVVQVDRNRAPEVWHALRGGWHYHVARTGVVSAEAKKDEHSHPGDAMGYGAAVLFPTGQHMRRPQLGGSPQHATYFESEGNPGPEPFRIGADPQKQQVRPAHGSPLPPVT